METPIKTVKAKKHRSPTYPGISLQAAIKRATEFYEREHRNPASFRAAVSHWDYSEKSSGALVTVAALKSFGLFDEMESGGSRTFKVSDLGLKIVADKRPDSPEREAAIREAALRPKVYAEIWRKYNGRLPSDAELEYRLENDWSFNKNVIKTVIKEMRETISFAKLTESDKVGEAREEKDGVSEVKVGEYVQWVSQGVDQFVELKKVIGFSDDGQYAFLDGEKSGALVSELEVGDAPAAPPSPANRTAIRRQRSEGERDMREDVFSLETGGEVTISWPAGLTKEMVTDISDWLKIVERKIARSAAEKETAAGEAAS